MRNKNDPRKTPLFSVRDKIYAGLVLAVCLVLIAMSADKLVANFEAIASSRIKAISGVLLLTIIVPLMALSPLLSRAVFFRLTPPEKVKKIERIQREPLYLIAVLLLVLLGMAFAWGSFGL